MTNTVYAEHRAPTEHTHTAYYIIDNNWNHCVHFDVVAGAMVQSACMIVNDGCCQLDCHYCLVRREQCGLRAHHIIIINTFCTRNTRAHERMIISAGLSSYLQLVINNMPQSENGLAGGITEAKKKQNSTSTRHNESERHLSSEPPNIEPEWNEWWKNHRWKWEISVQQDSWILAFCVVQFRI